METVKKTDEYTIVKKRSGRYGVRRHNGTWVAKEDKVKILLAEGLIKVTKANAKPSDEAPEATSEEAPVEEAAAE